LLRAQHTLDLTLNELGQTGLPTKKTLALNERDYGDLSGLTRTMPQEMGRGAGADLRRSYDVPPPGAKA